MKPSNFTLPTPPLVGTFGRSELEVAAGAYILAAQAKDEWGVLTLLQIIQAVEEKRPGWLTNPFMRPDFYGLHAGGFIAIGQSGPDTVTTIEPTPKFFEALQKARKIEPEPEPALNPLGTR